MKSRVVAIASAALLAGLALPAQAAPGAGAAEWARGDRLSRHHWRPDFARGHAGGVELSAGLALGLRSALRAEVGRRAAPAVTMQWNRGAGLSLLPIESGGALLVLQMQP